jgi:hypothetical protein
MKRSVKSAGIIFASASLLTLAACGGGTPSSSPTGNATNPSTGSGPAPGAGPVASPAPIPVATDFTLSGTAATGAALAGAAIKVTDRNGVEVCSQVAAADGFYSCTIPLTAKGPFVITATLDEQTLISTVTEAATSIANVTPLTHLIAARLSPSGDPANLSLELKANGALYDKASLKAKVDDLLVSLKPLSDALVDGTHPITGAFKADGSGHDRLLDAVQVSVRPDGAGSNIEVTVKASAAATAAPIAVSYRSSAVTAPSLPSVAAASLPVAGVPVLMSNFLAKLAACYALPTIDRVSAVVNTGLESTSTVKAPACKTLFVGDDPASYLSNGQKIGSSRAANNFSGIFRDSATGVKFDRGNLEFLRANGDMVVTYRWTDVAGNTDNDQVVVRKVGAELRLIGNQYAYPGNVRALVQHRDFINTPAYTYLSTGYNIAIKNLTDGSGNPIFSKVEVTTPNGNVLNYIPSPGRSNLVIQGASGATNTGVIRLAAKYVDPTTVGNPAEKEGTSLFFKSVQLTDTELANIPDHGVWSLKYVHVDLTKVDVVQAYKTTSRAPTLAEANYMAFANVTPAWRAQAIAATAANGVYTFSNAPTAAAPNRIDVSVTGNLDAWMVPSGALAPTSVTAYGRAARLAATPTVPGIAYDDGLTVATNARKVTINCSKQSVADLHCDATSSAQYAQGSNFNAIELWARSPRQVEVSKMIALYKIL